MARPSLNDLRRMFYGADTDESASDAEWAALEAAYAAGTSFQTLLDAYNGMLDLEDLPVGTLAGDDYVIGVADGTPVKVLSQGGTSDYLAFTTMRRF